MLVFYENERSGMWCCACREPSYGPSYNCIECFGRYCFHHKSCVVLPLRLHHPLHPKHPLFLFPNQIYAEVDVQEYRKCKVYKEDICVEYNYHFSRYNFNLHIKYIDLPVTMESKVHVHPLTPFWKWSTFTCGLCGKEGTGIPNQCASCGFQIPKICASFLHRVKVICHKHPLNLTHSHEVHPSDSRFC